MKKAYIILLSILAWSCFAQTGTNISRYPRTNFVATEGIFLFSATNISTTTSFGITASNLFYQITNGLVSGVGDAGGTNARQFGAANLTNWSTIPTGAMANVVAADFLTNWAGAISNYVTAATNAPQVTNWINGRQPASANLTNWSLIPTGAMANVVAADFLTNWANAISNRTTAVTNSASVTNWINSRQPASANLTNWSLIPTGEMANVVSTAFLTNWANAISNYANTKQHGTALLSNLVSNPNTAYTNSLAAGTNIALTTSGGTTTLNVPTDFTNVYYINKDNNLSAILTNVPNNSKVLIGSGNWTNVVTHMSVARQIGHFHLINKTNVDIQVLGDAWIWNTNRGDGFNISNCNNVRITGLGFYGWRTTNLVLGTSFASIVVSRSRNVFLDALKLINSGNDGIHEDGELTHQSTNIVVENSFFYNLGSFYSDVGGRGYDGKCVQPGSHWTIRNNSMVECAGGVELYGSTAVPVVANTLVEGNYIENPISRGIYNFHTNNVGHIIRNNRIYFNDNLRLVSSNTLPGSIGIEIGTGNKLLIEGNYIGGLFTVNPIGNTGTGIRMALGSLGFHANDIVVRNNTMTNCEAGITVFNGNDKIKGVIISGNQIYQTYFWGILAAASDMIIENNLIVDPEQFGDAGMAGIGVGIFGTACTNIVVRNNVLRRSPGATVQDGIKIDDAARRVRLFDNFVDEQYSPRFTGNGTEPIPNLAIEGITGITTNFISGYRTNGGVAWALDPRGFVLVPNDLTNRSAAPTNFIAQGAESFGGMNLPNWTDHNGLTAALQPFIGHEQVYWIGTGAGGVPNTDGILPTTNGGTTITHTTPIESQMYMTDLATPATSNGCASIFSSVDLANAGAHNGSSKIGGWFFTSTWCSTNLIGQVVGGGAPRTFVGLTARAAEDYTNMVVTTNATGQYVGLMVDAKESTNMFLTARDASAEFRTNTGIPFIATNVYKFYMFNAPTSRFTHWRLDDAYSGATRSGWFSNNVPTNFMKFGIVTKNGTNRAHSVRYSKLYLQAPLAPPR